MEAEASDRDGLILPQRFLHIQNVQDGFHLLIHQRFQLSVLHLPESTLLMLVSALAGKEHIMAAYEEAVKERYRFFSFGDAMFIQ